MKATRRSIHILSQSIWQIPEIKNRMNRLIWKAAETEEMIFEKQPLENRTTVRPSRVHADFTRMLAGERCKFPETEGALQRIRQELSEWGFVALNGVRRVCCDELGVTGEVDADGVVEGDVPVLVEVKCVRFVPQVVRASEACQLMLYSLARNESRARAVLLLAIYIQPCPPFRIGIRPVLDFEGLEPLVRQLAA